MNENTYKEAERLIKRMRDVDGELSVLRRFIHYKRFKLRASNDEGGEELVLSTETAVRVILITIKCLEEQKAELQKQFDAL